MICPIVAHSDSGNDVRTAGCGPVPATPRRPLKRRLDPADNQRAERDRSPCRDTPGGGVPVHIIRRHFSCSKFLMSVTAWSVAR